ncbi:MAG: GntR family transcriptional regulator [Chloroflexi bacterium]|nr:GntR family transcriptional regulator [Chloroflexota bacterium]
MAAESSDISARRPAGRRFKRVPVAALHEEVVRAFCDALLTGQIKPGQRIVERDMAEEMGLSRGPIRDGLAVLERHGLVVRARHKASYVASLDQADVQDVYTVRRMFETFALRLAVEQGRLTEAALDPLRQLVAEMERAGESGDRVSILERDIAFHRALCEMSGSPRLLDLYDQTRLLRLLVFTISQLPHIDLQVLGPQHQQIVDALAEAIHHRDAAPAVVALERHLESSCQLAIRQIAQAGGEEQEVPG